MKKHSPCPLFLHSPIEGVELLHHPFDLYLPEDMQRSPIGKIAEHCFKEALEKSGSFDLISHSVAIQGEERTLGELDFILKDRSRERFLHVEFVYKYYLYIPWMSSGLTAWIGPNFRDRLIYKLNHLQDHQFPILSREETQGVLADLGVNSTRVDQTLSFYAELFYPMHLKGPDGTDGVNPDCERGQWSFFSEFQEQSYPGADGFHLCTKKEWLVSPDHSTVWHSHEEVLEEIKDALDGGMSPMLWVRTRQGIQQIFIIPDAFLKQR